MHTSYAQSQQALETQLRNMTTDELINYASNAAVPTKIEAALLARLRETRNTLAMIDHTLGELGVDIEEFVNAEWKPLEAIGG